MTNIFVGNLAYQTTESELEAAFAAYGAVEKTSVVRDRDTGQPRGFAFVEMTNQAEAMKAIEALNGQELNGRALNVNEARPRPERGGLRWWRRQPRRRWWIRRRRWSPARTPLVIPWAQAFRLCFFETAIVKESGPATWPAPA